MLIFCLQCEVDTVQCLRPLWFNMTRAQALTRARFVKNNRESIWKSFLVQINAMSALYFFCSPESPTMFCLQKKIVVILSV